MIIDTHCHLYRSEYEDLNQLINEMQKDNIYAVVNGCDTASNIEAIELSKKYNNIYAAIGYHPENINNIEKDYIKYLEDNISNIVAIGEIGLDYHWISENKEIQRQLLINQLSIAEKYNLPVIIHTRDSIQDMYDILKNYKLKGIIHAFSGSYEMAINFIKLGYKIGIGGVLTFKNSHLGEIVSRLDINDIVLETDSPYLTPEPNRGKQNNPLNLKYVIERISNLKRISYDEVCRITTSTATALFDLKPKI